MNKLLLAKLIYKIYMMGIGIAFVILFIGSVKLLTSSFNYVAVGNWFGMGVCLAIGIVCVSISSLLIISWILTLLTYKWK